uniref:Uncharacterized protein AlNc14C4G656 n=1 Tax=Albugo laibachii Nc14 TaxID=890382 RepID=F0W0L5_9STRA|nr:conserved hypothetical protein [Albugo laibachii Nc14]|eukprot:CCA14587.1 conserved hypothetical protein [Albugo laibachii Nc14]
MRNLVVSIRRYRSRSLRNGRTFPPITTSPYVAQHPPSGKTLLYSLFTSKSGFKLNHKDVKQFSTHNPPSTEVLLMKPEPEDAIKTLTKEHKERAKKSLKPIFRVVRKAKAGSKAKTSLHQTSTVLLHEILSKLKAAGEYDLIETMFYSWDEIAPIPQENLRYKGILLTYYASALTQQQKFSKLINLFDKLSDTSDAQLPCTLSHKILESISIACWHTKRSKLAIDLVHKAESLQLDLRERTYVHVITAMVYDRSNCDIQVVLGIWEKMNNQLGMTMPIFLQPLILLRALESNELDRAMQLYRLPSNQAWVLSYMERFRFEMLFQALLDMDRYPEILHIFSTLLQADGVPNEFRVLMSRFLLNHSLLDIEWKQNVTSRDLDMTLSILKLMHSTKIGIRPNRLYPLMSSLIRFSGTEYTTIDGRKAEFPCIENVPDLLAFVEKYNGTIKWTSFFVSETLMVLAHSERLDFIEELMEYALSTHTSVSYFALEAIIISLNKLNSPSAAKKDIGHLLCVTIESCNPNRHPSY